MPTMNNKIHRGTLALLRDLAPRRVVTSAEALRVAELQASRLRSHLDIEDAHFAAEALDLPRIRIEFDVDLPSSGMAFWNGVTSVIVLNATEARTRQRFSLLHEFKHIIDHTTKNQLYGPRADRNDPAAERAADYFAACVLMPKLYVKRHWGQGPRTVSELAKTFEVSPAAMRYRLNQLGLLEQTRRCRWTQTTYRRARPQSLELAA